MPTKPWKIRAVQIDLARQMETLDTIRHFIDFAQTSGFNAVALYLEGRVRTPSFPYPATHESYTPEQMREIVTHASQRQMDLIPIVSTLGHMNLFLDHEELKPLAELREGIAGRLGTRNLNTFCPSVEETYRFLENYLTEISAIFPGKYLHIGCDEVWDMGCCSRCAARLRQGEKLDDLYAKHILRVHQVVSGKLGKRVMMWDDFLEELPTVLAALPTDIVQCVWQYDTLVEQTKTHFGRRRRDHRMAEYDRRGISYVVCPWASCGTRNTESLTRYAQRFHPVGGLLTLWDGHELEDQYPVIAFAGRRWSDPEAADGQQIANQAYAELFGLDDAMFLQAVWTAKSLGHMSKRQAPEDFLRGPLMPYAFERANQARLLGMVLASFRDRVRGGFPRDVLDEILLSLRRELVQHDIHAVVVGLYEGWNGAGATGVSSQPTALLAKGRQLLGELLSIADRRRANWQVRRPNIAAAQAGNTDQFERGLHDKLAAFLESIETGRLRETGLFVVRYSLPDYYGRPMTQWHVQYEGSAEWVALFNGTPKPWDGDYSDCPFFTFQHPIPVDRKIVRAKVEVTGFGGIGLLYAEAQQGPRVLRPQRVENVAGIVQQPNHILVDDTGACWLGEQATAEAFHNPALALQINALEIILG
ncbi:MAG: family 20 glycosylhydrolase [Phycisphaerae bacterium]